MVLYFFCYKICNKVICSSPPQAPVPILSSPLLSSLSVPPSSLSAPECWKEGSLVCALGETDIYTLFVHLFISSSPKFTQKDCGKGHYCHPKPLGSI